MKIVVNECWGGFSISDFAMEKLGTKSPFAVDRMDERLISLIEEFGSEKISGNCADLRVEEVPDDATDWWIDEYDGSETLCYVKDGKRYFA